MLSQGFSVCSCLARNVDPASLPTGEWSGVLKLETVGGAGRPWPQGVGLEASVVLHHPGPRLQSCCASAPGPLPRLGRCPGLQVCAWRWGWEVGVCMGRLHCPPFTPKVLGEPGRSCRLPTTPTPERRAWHPPTQLARGLQVSQPHPVGQLW